MTVYYSDKQLAQKFGVTRNTIWRWTRDKVFPQPVKFSAGCTRWRSDDIQEWMAEREKDKGAYEGRRFF